MAVIGTTALGGVAPVARCIELGADDFLHKPVDPWLLKARVESSLARKQHRDLQNAALRRWIPGGPTQARTLELACVLVARLQRPGTQAEPPQAVMELLSSWATLMFDAIEARGGEVAQFGGDTLLALFGEPGPAVGAAQDMVEVAALFNAERGAAGQAAVAMGIGISRGEVVVGSAATAKRAAQVCIGAPASRAAQLAEACLLRADGLLMDDGTRAGMPGGLDVVAVEDVAEGTAFFVAGPGWVTCGKALS